MYSHFKRVFLIFLALLLGLASGCSCAGGKADVAAPVRVSYLGPEGTYTQEACETFSGRRCRCFRIRQLPARSARSCRMKRTTP